MSRNRSPKVERAAVRLVIPALLPASAVAALMVSLPTAKSRSLYQLS